jgi:hypothetical protein
MPADVQVSPDKRDSPIETPPATSPRILTAFLPRSRRPSVDQNVSSPLTQSPHQASDLILGALDRDRGRSSKTNFLGLKRVESPKSPEQRLSVIQPSKPIGGSKSSNKYRAPSPFFRARRSREKARARDSSPEVGPLAKDAESDVESIGGPVRPRVSAYEDDSGSDAETENETGEDDDDEEDYDIFDEETEKNTEANAVFLEDEQEEEERGVLDTFGEEIEQDPLGEGPNVVVPPQPLFPTSNFAAKRRKSLKSGLELVTSRPTFARDRCTMTLTHGDPDGALEKSGKRMRRYVVLSDLSNESRYAVEWAIGTVARDGDEIFLISVKEDESKGELDDSIAFTYHSRP